MNCEHGHLRLSFVENPEKNEEGSQQHKIDKALTWV